MQEEFKQHSIELNEIIPRDYMDAIIHYNEKHYISRINFFLAQIALTRPTVLKQKLKDYQSYKSRELEGASKGEWNYDPLFTLGDKQDILSAELSDLVEMIREGIAKKEGSKKIWDRHGEQVIHDTHIRGLAIDAVVDSKGNRNRREGGKRNEEKRVSFKNVFLDTEGNFNVQEPMSSSDDFVMPTEKGGRFHTHVYTYDIAVVLTQLHRFMKDQETGLFKVKGSLPRRTPFLPINVIDDPFLWYLTTDVALAYYVLDESKFEINKKLAQITDIQSAFYNSELSKDKIRFEVLKQGTRPVGDEKETKARAVLRNNLEESLLEKSGYRRTGIYLEFKGTDYETPVIRFEKGKSSVGVGLVDGVYILTFRKNSSGEKELLDKGRNMPKNEHPIKQLLRRQRITDDSVKEITDLCVHIPNPNKISIPYTMKQLYKRLIAKHNSNAIKEGLFNYYRL